MYRPPSGNSDIFLDRLDGILNTFNRLNRVVVTVGDLNINFNQKEVQKENYVFST